MLQEWKRLIYKKSGFSFLEIIIFIAIVCILGTLGISSISFYKSQLLKAEVEKLYFIICSAKEAAKTTSEDIVIIFNAPTNSYQLLNQRHALHKQLNIGFLKNAYGPPHDPRAAITRPITFANQQIKFNKNGNISAGSIYLIDDSQNFMYAITISVAKKVFIRKYKYSNSKWKLLN